MTEHIFMWYGWAGSIGQIVLFALGINKVRHNVGRAASVGLDRKCECMCTTTSC